MNPNNLNATKNLNVLENVKLYHRNNNNKVILICS